MFRVSSYLLDDLLDQLAPEPDSSRRQSDIVVAVINLVCTIVGGGSLILPFAFSLSGLLLGIALLAISAVCADFSLRLLCFASRKLGAAQYMDIVHILYGNTARRILTVILVMELSFVIAAYLGLLRDIVSSLVGLLVDNVVSEEGQQLVLILCTLACLPLSLCDSLHGLRGMCIVGFCSVLVLIMALCVTLIHAENPPNRFENLSLSTTKFSNVLEALPILSLAFLSHFNILPVYSQLQNPTAGRMRTVVHVSIGTAFVLYLAIAVLGYLLAVENTADNILLNFPSTGVLILMARCGLSTTMLCAVPLMLLPCRGAIFDLLEPLPTLKHDGQLKWCCSTPDEEQRGDESMFSFTAQSLPTQAKNMSANRLLHPLAHRQAHSYQAIEGPLTNTSQEGFPVLSRKRSSIAYHSCSKKKVAITLAILGACYLAVAFVPAVSILFYLCGASVGMMIGYICPGAVYCSLWRESQAGFEWRLVGSACLFVCGTIVGIVCTFQAVYGLCSGNAS